MQGQINPNLTGSLDLTQARPLRENLGIAFMGDTKVGPFEVTDAVAQSMLTATGNPNGRPNSDVLVPWVNALDITRRPRSMWIIDFGTNRSEEESALYEMPFEYIRQHVKPLRAEARSGDRTGVPWWLHQRPRPAMRHALSGLPRYLATPRVAKYRLFVWLDESTLPDVRLFVFAREDEYFFGVLHSRVHELWSLRMASWHGVGNDPTYNSTTCFETFPLPWAPGEEPTDDARVQAISEAACRLDDLRRNWLNPEGASATELKKRTLTNLYNARPTWLQNAHAQLDAAVFAAYGWPPDVSDEEILKNLLALNLERSEAERR